jgi:outer membrane immunogenic protein
MSIRSSVIRLALAGSMAAFCFAGQAYAADLGGGPQPGSYKDTPYYPAPLSWTGAYFGIHGGYNWGDTEATDRLASNGAPWNALGDQFSADVDGVVVGGQLGYNWQSGNLVFGLEGDVGYLGASGTGTSSLSSDTHVTSDGGLYVTARGRLGLAYETSLIYITGGYFGADLNSHVYDNVGTTLNTSDAGFQSGWTIGGGLEFAMRDGWSLKAEYLYYDLGKERVSGLCNGCGGTVIQNFDVENTGNIIRLGINRRW